MTLWLAETQAFDAILNRAEAEHNVEKHLKSQIDALRQVVDYGTHLIPRCWHSSGRTVRDMVLLPILLKQIVGMLDAATELLSKGCVESAMLPLRSLFEASIYLDWILKSKSPMRARAYYVWNVRRQLRWTNRAIAGTKEQKALAADLRGLSVVSSFAAPEEQKKLIAEAQRLSKHLAEPKNSAWSERFDRRRGSRLYDVEWYQVLFTKRRSLRFLAQSVHRMPEYRVIYELGSETMHSSKSDSHVRILDGGRLGIRSLRELTEFPFVFQMLMGTALHAYHAALDSYRREEALNFWRKYVETWRSVFMSRLKILYEYHEATLG